jgi:hypothetical protein
MIFHASDLKRVAIQAPQSARQIGVRLRSELGELQKRHSIFGGENDVHQDESDRLRYCVVTQYIRVIVTFSLAPLQGAPSGGVQVPGVKTPGLVVSAPPGRNTEPDGLVIAFTGDTARKTQAGPISPRLLRAGPTPPRLRRAGSLCSIACCLWPALPFYSDRIIRGPRGVANECSALISTASRPRMDNTGMIP